MGFPWRSAHRHQLDDEDDAGDEDHGEKDGESEDCGGAHRAGADPTVITFLTRRNCHLCEDALPLVLEVVGDASVEVIDVDDSGLAAEYGERVPVILVDGHEVLAGWFGRRDIEAVLPA